MPEKAFEMSLTAAPSPPPPAANAPPALPDDVPVREIRPRRGWVGIDYRELFHYRELLYFLAWRDIKVRYKQTVLGVAWAVLLPLITMVIFTLVFGGFAGMANRLPEELKARHVPYFLFVYAALVPWTFLSNSVGIGGVSLINQQHLLTKVYFPRLFVPTAVITASLLDTLIAFGVLIIMMLCAHFIPPWTTIWVFPLLLLTTLLAMGVTYALSALTVTYRDFRLLLPFIVNCWQFISPVAYPLNPQAQWKQRLLAINPMYGIIQAFRSALLKEHWDLFALGLAIAEIIAVLFFGMYYFKKTERRFADIA
jgi:lipopolysaccharide transport system permease protein